jgi:hypothetical protein
MNPSSAIGGVYDPSSNSGYGTEEYYGVGTGAYDPYVGLQQQQGYESNANVAGGYFTTVNSAYVPNPMGTALDCSTAAYERQHWQENVTNAVEPGTYYPVAEWQSPMVFGAPVSAVAYDKSYDAIYLATDTLSSSSSFSHSISRRGPPQRSAMIVTHQVGDGMLYSAVAGHPEAPPKVLQAIYSTLYGTTQTTAPTLLALVRN